MLKHLQEHGVNRYIIKKQGKMKTDVVVYLSKPLIQYIEEEAIKQLVDGTHLPGVCHPVIGLPDIHTGFGLPIGGVMATCGEDGVISAGAVGMDINCGVRLLAGNWNRCDVDHNFLLQFSKLIQEFVPCGVGKKSKHARLNIGSILQGGASELIHQGFGYSKEEQYIEEGGYLQNADPAALSKEAFTCTDQLSTLGGGNHFIELGIH